MGGPTIEETLLAIVEAVGERIDGLMQSNEQGADPEGAGDGVGFTPALSAMRAEVAGRRRR